MNTTWKFVMDVLNRNQKIMSHEAMGEMCKALAMCEIADAVSRLAEAMKSISKESK